MRKPEVGDVWVDIRRGIACRITNIIDGHIFCSYIDDLHNLSNYWNPLDVFLSDDFRYLGRAKNELAKGLFEVQDEV